MGFLMDFNNAVASAANTTADIMTDYAKQRSDFKLSNYSIAFQGELDAQLRELEKTDDYDTWQETMENWYQDRVNSITDQNNHFAAKNNYEAKAMAGMIEKSRVQTVDTVAKMAWQKQGQQMIVDYNNSLEQLKQWYQGQEYIDQANAGALKLKELGLLSPEQYDSLIKNNYSTGVYNYFSNQFDAALEQGIKDNKNVDTLISEVVNGKDDMKLYGADGLEIKVDKEVINNTFKKYAEQRYNAKLHQIQEDNYNWHDNKIGEGHALITKALTGEQVNLSDIYRIANMGNAKLQTQLGLELGKGQNEAFSKEYEALVKSANALFEMTQGGSGSVKKAAAKFDPKNLAEAYIDQAMRGTLTEKGGRSSIYRAEDIFNEKVLQEYQSYKIKAEGIPIDEAVSLTWKDMEEEFPAVNNFLEIAKSKLPASFEGVINNTETVLKTALEANGTGELFKTMWPECKQLITDMLYEVDVSKLDGPAVESLRKRANTAVLGMLGPVLKSKEIKINGEKVKVPNALENYKEGVVKQEKVKAQALKQLQDNEDYYQVKRGEINPKFVGSSQTETGIINLEKSLKDDIAKRYELDTGVKIDPDKIQITRETYDDNKYDVKSVPVFKVGNKTYKAYTEDGNSIQLQELKNGKWERVMTPKEQEEYNKPENIVKRAINNKDLSEMPPIDIKVTLGGGYAVPLTKELWKNGSGINKNQILLDFYKKDPEAAEKYFKSLPEKKKVTNPVKDSKK